MQIGDLVISKDILVTYPKTRWGWEIWKITGENIYEKDGSQRWELIKDNSTGCFGKDFVDEHYIKYNKSLEILYG